MNKISVLDNRLITVWVYPERKLIHHQMKAYCHGDEFRDALMKGAEAMERYQATKWLSDDRANGAVVPEDQAWSIKHFVPRVKAAGWTHWAVVQPTKLIGRSNITRIADAFASIGITTRIFADPDEALRWLDAL